jgi:hypothetical protein
MKGITYSLCPWGKKVDISHGGRPNMNKNNNDKKPWQRVYSLSLPRLVFAELKRYDLVIGTYAFFGTLTKF